MNEILIQINWVYFLGIIGALIGVAWYTGSRFSKIETDLDWIKDIVRGLKIDFGDKEIGAFKKESPVELSEKGETLLRESGLKGYIDERKDDFIQCCRSKNPGATAYDVQGYIFDLFDNFRFETEFEARLKQYAFEQGVSLDFIRRVGAIYLRNMCLKAMDLSKRDIDTHGK